MEPKVKKASGFSKGLGVARTLHLPCLLCFVDYFILPSLHSDCHCLLPTLGRRRPPPKLPNPQVTAQPQPDSDWKDCRSNAKSPGKRICSFQLNSRVHPWPKWLYPGKVLLQSEMELGAEQMVSRKRSGGRALRHLPCAHFWNLKLGTSKSFRAKTASL